jgi:hypothetical protein
VPKTKFKEVEVEEKQLEDLLFEDPDQIEEGMKILGRQVQTDTGPLDLLAMDTDGVLTVVELKNEPDENQLDQGLRYYDWARSRIEWISRSYGNKVDVTSPPRLVLISPTFSDNLKRIAKYVNVELQLLEYHVMQIESGEKHVLCTPVEVEGPPEPPTIPTREGHLARIEDMKMRDLCRRSLEQLESMGIEVRPIQNYYFSIWYRGKRFMYINCKKQFFGCYVQRTDNSWTDLVRIKTPEEWQKLLDDEIQPYCKGIGKGTA